MWRLLVIPLASLALAAPAQAAIEPLTGLHVTSTGLREVSLAWDAPTAAHPYVELSLTGPAPGGGRFGGSGWLSATTATTELELVCGSGYTITAAWSDDPAQLSGPAAATEAATQACTHPPPAAPSGLEATPDETEIAFGWDDPPVAVRAMYVTLTGPGRTPDENALAPRGQYDSGTVVCGETYVLRVRYRDDEGQTSPASELTAAALPCSPDGAGPANLRLTASTTRSLALAWDAYAGTDLWMPRLTLAGGTPSSYLRRTATAVTLRDRLCGTAYTVSLQWVFLDGTVSEPSTLTASTAACPPPFVPPVLRPPVAPPFLPGVTLPVTAPVPAACRVPALKGLKLATARKRLNRAHCRLGRVTRRKGRHGRVLASRPGAGGRTRRPVKLTVGR